MHYHHHHHHTSFARLRRYISRPYLYPLFFFTVLFLLIRWHSRPDSNTSSNGLDYYGNIADKQRIDSAVIGAEDGEKRVIQKPPTSEESAFSGRKNSMQKKMNTVSLSVYMEAQCPDTTGFIRRQLLPAWSRLGPTNRINITIVPFGKASCMLERSDYKCECQHGPDECELNQLMNCAIELLPEADSFVPLIGCVQGKNNLSSAFKSCLDGHSSSDWLWECATGKRGRVMHARAGNLTAAIGNEFNFVPWVVLDGQRDNDAFYALEENLCKRFREPKPVQCVKFSR